MKAIIVEDEPLSREFLGNLLRENHPAIEILARTAHVDEAVALTTDLSPDILFLDIELQQGTGFDILKQINCKNMQVIFTTAFDHYALSAIRFSGVEYLLKPIDMEGLDQVMMRVMKKKDSNSGCEALEQLLVTLNNNYTPSRLFLPALTGDFYVDLSEISRIESTDGACTFILSNGRSLVVRNNLKEYESLLAEHEFFRPHPSHLVSLRQISRLESGGNDLIIMKDNSIVPLSARKKDELMGILQKG